MAIEIDAAAVGREQRRQHGGVGEHEHPACVEQDGVEGEAVTRDSSLTSAARGDVAELDAAGLQHGGDRREVGGIEVGDVVEQALPLLRVEDDPLGRKLFEGGCRRIALPVSVTVAGVATPNVVAVSVVGVTSVPPPAAAWRARMPSSTCNGPTPHASKIASAEASSAGADGVEAAARHSTATESSPSCSSAAVAAAGSIATELTGAASVVVASGTADSVVSVAWPICSSWSIVIPHWVITSNNAVMSSMSTEPMLSTRHWPCSGVNPSSVNTSIPGGVVLGAAGAAPESLAEATPPARPPRATTMSEEAITVLRMGATVAATTSSLRSERADAVRRDRGCAVTIGVLCHTGSIE